MENHKKLKNDLGIWENKYSDKAQGEDAKEKVAQIVSLLLLFLAMLFLSSCSSTLLPVSQEMGDMALLRTFAVDKGEIERWLVTVSTGKQTKGLQGEQEPPTVLAGESATLSGACRQLEGLTDHTIFYSYIDQLVVSESLAKEGLEELLTYFSTNRQLSLGTGIWLCEGSAQEMLGATCEEGAEAYLTTLVAEGKLGVGGITRKVGQVLTDIREDRASFIPILRATDQGSLEESGYGIVRGEQFVSILQGDTAKGFALLHGQDQLLEVVTAQGTYALDLSQITVDYQGTWDDQKLKSVDVTVHVQGEPLEYPTPLTEEDWQTVAQLGERMIQQWCYQAITRLQSLHCDALGMGGRLTLKHPLATGTENWKDNWEATFSQVSVGVSVTLEKEKG